MSGDRKRPSKLFGILALESFIVGGLSTIPSIEYGAFMIAAVFGMIGALSWIGGY